MNILPQNAPRQLEHVHSVEEGSTDTAEDERRHDEDERCFDNTDVGPLLSHVSLYHMKLLSRTYLYDFVCDVTRFTDLVTSQGGGGVRSGPGAARTILLFHTINSRPSEQPRMVGSTFGV
jgi:hypothetical protein